MKVIIAEKPSVAAATAAYGEQYRKWSYDALPILPKKRQYAMAQDKGRQFKILKELTPDISNSKKVSDHHAIIPTMDGACKG